MLYNGMGNVYTTAYSINFHFSRCCHRMLSVMSISRTSTLTIEKEDHNAMLIWTLTFLSY